MKKEAMATELRSSQAKLSRRRSLLFAGLGFIAIMLVIAVNTVILFQNLLSVQGHQSSIAQTSQVLEELDLLTASLLDAETAERGFIITGVTDYLEPFHEARVSVRSHIERIREFTMDNQEQQLAIPVLEKSIEELMDRYDQIIKIRRDRGFEATKEHVLSGKGEMMMDGIRVVVTQMKDREQSELTERSLLADLSARRVKDSVTMFAVVNVSLLAIAYFLLRRFIVRNADEQERLTRDVWLKEGLAKLNDSLRENQTTEGVCKATLLFLAEYVGIQVGTFYTAQGRYLKIGSTYAHDENLLARESFVFGQGLVGEVAVSRKLIHLQNVPDSYLKVTSTLGESISREIVILPVLNDEELEGVIEMGSLTAFTPEHFRLFEFIKEKLGISIDAAQSRAHLQLLLEETQSQSEELQAQQEELRSTNEELETQALALKMTQERQQMQQEALRQSNEELSQQTKILELQKHSLSLRNADLVAAKLEIERKAKELAQASQYKSEFLANMSHELRTPLNSMLILSTLLFENESKNLNDKQIGFAKTIYRSGNDLLSLINDILDLAKVEAGKLSLLVEPIDLKGVLSSLDQSFRYLSEEKNLSFVTDVDQRVPSLIKSDRQRLEQVLKNFLSNAVKFTDSGSVTLRLTVPEKPTELLFGKSAALVFKVVDTGIGIPEDKQEIIFDAFQQADGSTSREYGGTGLGLTISRELAGLLGGKIEVESVPGEGSTFSLYLPEDATVEADFHVKNSSLDDPLAEIGSHDEGVVPIVAASALPPREFQLFGDIDNLTPGDRLVLIVDDDTDFAKILLDQAHSAGFKAIVALDGQSCFEALEKFSIQGILLDLRLPDMSGLSILERIKGDLKTRHIPIHVISGADNSQNALKMGAVGYLTKPATKQQLSQAFGRIETTLAKSIKRVLVVEDDSVQRDAICHLLKGRDIEIDAVSRGADAEERLNRSVYDCMILDLKLPDISGFDLLESFDKRDDGLKPPVVVYTGKDLSKSEIERLGKYSESIIIKGVKSPERLLDEVSLFLHRVETQMPSDSQALLRDLRASEKSFHGRKVLIVDDDMRNVFALANALEVKGFTIVVGKNGREGFEKVCTDSSIDIVLMDIMMPVMDGYEATRKIRSVPHLKKLPIIALTAKVMKGDQERCLEAGANDYLPKPIDLDRLLSLLRVWIPPKIEL